MRVTTSSYYKNIFNNNNSKINRELFDVNRQIASGLSIEYASDNVRTFSETMRLDNEMTTLSQIKTSTQNGYKVANQTDATMSEIEDNLTRMRTLLIQATNDEQDEVSRDAVAKEMRGIEKNLKLLANTSINGKFLFSGSSVDVKPIDENGIYHGNDGSLDAYLGSRNKQQYNVSGEELFLGEEINIRKKITSNVVNTNLFDGSKITGSSSLRELMGDKDEDENTHNTDYFYIRGNKSDGTAFHSKIVLSENQKVDDLLHEIGKAYGNTDHTKLVDVSLNKFGQIIIQDKQQGSSKLDFHMIGAVDFDTTTDENNDGNNDDADVTNINDLDIGESDYSKIKDSSATSDLFIKEFVLSDLKPASTAPANIDGLLYDRAQFSKETSKLTSNVMQVLKSDNTFATDATKISEVADLSQGTAGTLDETVLELRGKDITGSTYTAQINFKSSANGGSTFSVDTDNDGNVDTDYTIYDMGNPRSAVDADEMTYRQMMDVINMIATDTLPATSPGTADQYDTAVADATLKGNVSLSYDGKITFNDLTSSDTQATIALYDTNSGDFSSGADSASITFNTNNALTIQNSKTDFFKTLNSVITSVEAGTSYPDASSNRNTIGMENAIEMVDDLSRHVHKMQSKIGAYSNALQHSLERTELLEMSTAELRSSVIDTDVAEASLKLQQLTLNYQAILSTVGKVSKLSLVNYL